MLLDKIAFATMTWARTDEEQQVLRASMNTLATFGRPIFVADGGSGPDFHAFLCSLPHMALVETERAGVIGQMRASLRAALTCSNAFVVYTESDKQHFFETELKAFVEQARDDEQLGVSIAARTASSLATFPATQRRTEGVINDLFGREIGITGDFCYGPLILNKALLPCLDGVDPALGWGWRFYLMGLAHRVGYRIEVFEADLPCPPGQRDDCATERMHRMQQLSQDLRGTILALQDQPVALIRPVPGEVRGPTGV